MTSFRLPFGTRILLLSWLLSGCGLLEAEKQDVDLRDSASDGEDGSGGLSDSEGMKFQAGDLLIKFKEGVLPQANTVNPHNTGVAAIDGLNEATDVRRINRIASVGSKTQNPDHDIFRWYKVSLGEDSETGEILDGDAEDPIIRDENLKRIRILEAIKAEYEKDPNVERVELNRVVKALAVPNDPLFHSSGSWNQAEDDLWGLKQMELEAAWDRTTGSESIVVAVIDTGVDRDHPDLAANMWVNTGEIPDNGVDDDGNGYVDDYYGWDFANNDNDPYDDNGHGTHCSGTIGAIGNNNFGVVGVNWKSRIMALKFLTKTGSGSSSGSIAAIRYAVDMGARVLSNSWGGKYYSAALEDAVDYAHSKGVVFVAAAGNDNIDAMDFSPAGLDRAITVGASTPQDERAWFSNWGDKIDVVAPGGGPKAAVGVDNSTYNILSTLSAGSTYDTDKSEYHVQSQFIRVAGTSMAAPHVSGLAALLLSANPELSPEEVRQLLRQGANDVLEEGKDQNTGYGRINARGSMELVDSDVLSPLIDSPKSRSVIFGSSAQIKGSIGGGSLARLEVRAGSPSRNPTQWRTVRTLNKPVSSDVLATFDSTLLPDGVYVLRITAFDSKGNEYSYSVHDIEVDNFDVAISSPNVAVADGVTVDVTGTAFTKNGLALDHYELAWGIGEAPTTWSTEGITLAGGGTQAVSGGTLGTWDTSSLEIDKKYSLRLTVVSANGSRTLATSIVSVDADILPGWPKTLPTIGSYDRTHIPLVDVNGDGSREVVILLPSGQLHIYRKNGTSLPGLPAALEGAQGYVFHHPVNVADLDRDGKMEIIATGEATGNFKIFVTRIDGTALPGWPQRFSTYFPPDLGPDRTPAVGDLDLDGTDDLLFIDNDNKWQAKKLDGSNLTGFPKSAPALLPTRVVIADLDGDGVPEIAVGSFEGNFYVLNNSAQVLHRFSAGPIESPLGEKNPEFASPPAVGDIDGDGVLELFIVGVTYGGGPAAIYGLNMNGALLSGWPHIASRVNDSATKTVTPAVADIDGDGKDEVIVATHGIEIYDDKGLVNAIGASNTFTPALADVDGDSSLEVVSAYLGKAVQIHNLDGGTIWTREPPKTPTQMTSRALPTLADLDNDGSMELATMFKGAEFNIMLWELPGQNAGPADAWPMAYHDPARTSRLSRPIDDDSTCTVVNEGETGDLSCPDGTKITGIDFASYGQPEGSCEDGFAVSDCHSAISTAVVGYMCVGRTSCSVPAQSSLFGDPCIDKPKHLAIEYTCGTGIDNCPDDPDKTQPGQCGCGIPDTDSDGDGTADCNDGCPDDPDHTDADDCTPQGPIITASGEFFAANEVKENAFDGNTRTKWLTFQDACWIQYDFPGNETKVITEYSITSANDSPERDPKDWRLLGSNDGVNFITIDQRSGELFSTRIQRRAFYTDNQSSFKMYRLDISSNRIPSSANSTQLAEIELIAGAITDDECPNDPNKTEPGICGCGVPEGSCTYEETQYEAEQYTQTQGCGISTSHPGYTGTGFVDFGGNGSWIEWDNVDIASANESELTFRYANGSGSRPAAVIVNGKSAGNVAFVGTGGWDKWSTVVITASLQQGRNTIRLMANTTTGGPNVDHMIVGGYYVDEDECPNDPNKTEPGECGCGIPDTDSDGDGTPDCDDDCPSDPDKLEPGECGCGVPEGSCSYEETQYEAEHFTSTQGCGISASHPGYTGTGFVDFGGNGSWIEWNNIDVSSSGEFELTFRYANGSGSRPAAVIVNGNNAGNVAFVGTGGWDKWGTVMITVSLQQGRNAIRLMANTTTGGPNVDHMIVSGYYVEED